MKECYDWDKNELYIKDIRGNIFDLKFNWDKTIVDGKSATGKTLLVTKIKEIQANKNADRLKKYGASNIFILDNSTIDLYYKQKNKLIIVDRAELILTTEMIDHTKLDFDNRYLIFCRKPMGFSVSPNHFAEFIVDNNKITIQYRFNEPGWC